ncbi:MAG: DUF4835 family protein [Bacteroidales bacterium]|nr:DUF4835 family protein [Bacteroidales bacterium]
MRNSIICTLLTFCLSATAQELQCNIQVNSSQVQGTNKQVFETLQTSLYEFVNNRNWTNHVFSPDERIECNILINITDFSGDVFKGDFQVQSRRPVYNSSYNSVMFNFKDNDVKFNYVEYQPLEFNLTTHTSNLTSLVAFYAYIIIGLDYDSFANDGGNPFFENAEKIVQNAQNEPEKGWRSFDSPSRKNRYWLINQFQDEEYAPLRSFSYRYHRQGLDVMDKKPDQGRSEILESLKLLQEVYRSKPDPFMFLLQVVLDAKRDEIINVFSEGSPMKNLRLWLLCQK